MNCMPWLPSHSLPRTHTTHTHTHTHTNTHTHTKISNNIPERNEIFHTDANCKIKMIMSEMINE